MFLRDHPNHLKAFKFSRDVTWKMEHGTGGMQDIFYVSKLYQLEPEAISVTFGEFDLEGIFLSELRILWVGACPEGYGARRP